MIQHSQPLPAGMPLCGEGHRPQLVESRGAPRGHRVGTACPHQWHVECARCSVATVPTTSQPVALLHWRGKPDLFHIPLSKLGHVRERMASIAANA